MTTIDQKHCIPCEGGVCPLNEQSSGKLLEEINQWQVSSDNKHISRDFRLRIFTKPWLCQCHCLDGESGRTITLT